MTHTGVLRVRGSAVWAALVIAAAVTVSACSGGSPEPPPIDEPETTVSASPEATQASSPSGVPDQPTPKATSTSGEKQTGGSGSLDNATRQEAIAFVSGLLKVLDEGGQTGDFDKATALFDESCTTCVRGIVYAKSIYTQNHKLVGGKYTDPRYTVAGGSADDVLIQVESTVSAYKIVDSAGKTVEQQPASDDVSNFRIKKSSSGWHVVEWSNS
jgi:hypothetical protein